MMKIKKTSTLPLLTALCLAFTPFPESNLAYAVSPSQVFYDDLDEDDSVDSEVAVVKELSAVALEGHAAPAEQQDAKRVFAPLAVQHVKSGKAYSPDNPDWQRHFQNMKQVEQNLNQQFGRLCKGTQATYQPEAIKDLRLSTAARRRIADTMREALAFARHKRRNNPRHCDYRPFKVIVVD